MGAPGRRAVRHVETHLDAVVLVCRKCSRKLDGGFGDDGDPRLAKALRRHLGNRRKALKARSAVIEVGCLDLCPLNAVVALRADRPGDWVVVPKGTAVAQVMDHLGLTAEETGRR